jgi:hypothetical protein
MSNEPRIKVNGFWLTNAQAMAVRVAVSDFHMQMCIGDQMREDLGLQLADAYRDRLQEVLKIMLTDNAPASSVA